MCGSPLTFLERHYTSLRESTSSASFHGSVGKNNAIARRPTCKVKVSHKGGSKSRTSRCPRQRDRKSEPELGTPPSRPAVFLVQRFAREASPLTTIGYTHPGDEELWRR